MLAIANQGLLPRRNPAKQNQGDKQDRQVSLSIATAARGPATWIGLDGLGADKSIGTVSDLLGTYVREEAYQDRAIRRRVACSLISE